MENGSQFAYKKTRSADRTCELRAASCAIKSYQARKVMAMIAP